MGPRITNPKVAKFCARRWRLRRLRRIQCDVFARVATRCPQLMLRPYRASLLHMVAEQRCEADPPRPVAVLHQLTTACHVNIEIGDLLAQRIAIDAKQIGAFRLITTGCIERNFDQRQLNFSQDTAI